MHTRRRKVWRDIKAYRGRTALVAASIFIGVMGVVTLVSAADILLRQLRADIDPDYLAMSHVALDPEAVPSAAQNAGDHAALLASFSARPDVTTVQANVNNRMYWKPPDDDTFIQANFIATHTDPSQRAIHPLELIMGAWPQPHANQLLIERRMADRYGLSVGDTMDVRMLSEIGNTTDGTIPYRAWTISGIVFNPYSGGDQAVYGYYDDAVRICDSLGYTSVWLRYTTFKAAEEDRFDLRTVVETTAYAYRGGYIEDPEKSSIIEEPRQWAETVAILSIVAMLVSSFLVITVISTILAEQKSQIGVMKSLGAAQPDHLMIYGGIALLYGLIGLVPGTLLGIFLANWLIAATAPLLNVYITGFNVSALGIGLGIGLGLGVPVIASILPVYRGTRVTILEAMTDLGLQSRFGIDPITHRLGNLHLPFSVHRGLVNIYQQRARLLLTILTLTLAVGAFMGVTSVFVGLNRLADALYSTWNFQLGVGVRRDSDRSLDDIATLITTDQTDIEAIYETFTINAQALLDPDDDPNDPDNLRDIQVQAIDPTTNAIRFELADGRLWADSQTDNGLVLSRRTADQLGVGAGDTVVMRYNGQNFEFEVIGVDNYGLNGAWANLNALSAATGGLVQADTLWLRYEDDTLDANALDRRASDIREVLLANGVLSGYYNQQAFREQDEEMIATAGLVFNIASGVMSGIGAIGLVVVLSISVFERQREIGVLRSIGASSSAIALQFLVEGMLVGVIAWLLGIPLAYGLAELLKAALPIGQFGIAFQPIALMIGLLGAIAIALVGSLGPSLSAARRTVADILRYA